MLYLHRNKENVLFWNHAKIAQLVEHDLAKVGVAGSSPVFRSETKYLIWFILLYKFAIIAQLVERWLPKPKVAGSSPVYRSTENQGVTDKSNSFFYVLFILIYPFFW